MATLHERGIPLSALNPKFLHTNSTSHTWPFSAIAELVDNAYDPDVQAKQFWIDWTVINNQDCLTFMDNGAGLTRNRMHKMLSFGFSDKRSAKGHVPVGLYGNGFKSGSMRLGKDVIVFSKTRDTMSVGLLSQTYLAAIRAQHIVVPIVTFRRHGQSHMEGATSLQAILKHSLFKTERELFAELRIINATGSTGTRIIIWNLQRITNGKTEFDFTTDRYDIRIWRDVCEVKQFGRSTESVPESEYSLQAYCSILYLKPRMQIIIRGRKVRTQLVSKSLAYIANDNYRPAFLSKRVRITFGYNTMSKEQYGIMMYHRNRLIKAYERVGCQRKADSRGVGVIGVIECDFLQPTHNKQDFDNTDKYRKTMYNLGVKLEEYWNEIRYKRKKEDPKCSTPIEDAVKFPDQSWVQCDNCLKWRRLPDGIDCGLLPKKWFCQMNPDPQFRSCQAEEEPEDSDEDQRSYPKPYKRQNQNPYGKKNIGSNQLREPMVEEASGLAYKNMSSMWDSRGRSRRKTSKTQIDANDGGQIFLDTVAMKPAAVGPSQCSTALDSSGSTDPGPLGCSPIDPIPLGRASCRLPTNKMPIVNASSFSSALARVKQKLANQVPMVMPVETFTLTTSSSPPLPKQLTSTRGQTGRRLTVRRAERKREGAGVRAGELEVEGGMITWPGQNWKRRRVALERSERQMERAKATVTIMEVEGGEEKKEQWVQLEAQQEQQDRLVELMQAASQERDLCREQVRELQKEVEELKTKCAALESIRGERTELSHRLENVEVERGALSSQCEQLKTELEDLKRELEDLREAGSRAFSPSPGEDYRLRSLRQSVGRLLVTFVPALNLDQVDYNSNIIDKILEQVLYEVT
ncbi:MORC family CW-type zinc finger protein 3-like isoform X3 [Anguilla rostrata]|uniref:MORC family CW-type zinc finger protein 3-like isoform X3 n=1 Tax=Anguilla rostrata TaxID=7938 RepID=UPI0030D1ACC0